MSGIAECNPRMKKCSAEPHNVGHQEIVKEFKCVKHPLRSGTSHITVNKISRVASTDTVVVFGA